MRKSGHRFFVLALLLFGMSPRGYSEDAVTLRVLSYNIHHGEGTDKRLDLARIAKVINSVRPDLVALQEVDRRVQRTGNVDQPAELARLTGMQVVFGANISLQGGEYGNAVLSRFPIVRHRNHRLPNVDRGEQRGVLEVEIDVPGISDNVLLYATHFDHRPDDSERFQSADAVNALVARTSQPALLAGDLNDTPESRTLEKLRQQWAVSSRRPLPTVPAAHPTRQIDFILYRPQERWKVVQTIVPAEAVASDHRAIFSELQLLPVGSGADENSSD